jgi:L,D-transpeptidase catalytic domain/Putative peptidoglycan binding domain
VRVRLLSVLAATALAALLAPVGAQAAADCYRSSTPAGPAPLTVMFTSTCGAMHWSFGDGGTAEGAEVTHTFAPGAWPVDANGERVVLVVSRALSLRVPKLVGFRHQLTFRGAIVPAAAGEQVIVLARGAFLASARTRGDGTFSVTRRIHSPGPYVARWLDTQSEEHATTVRPQLSVRIVGSGAVGEPLSVVARLVPATAGSLRIRVLRGRALLADRHARRLRLDTRLPGTLRIRVSTTSAAGFQARTRALRTVVRLVALELGSRGGSVRALEQQLHELRYALLGVDGVYAQDTYDAVMAFQKVHGMPRTGRVDVAFWRRLARTGIPRARYAGTHVEVDKTRQVLFEVRKGRVVLVVQVSTGATGNTPLGLWHVYSRVAGWSWVLYYPVYFLRGFAIHGYPDVPPWPASHGCVRVPMWIARSLYDAHGYGTTVVVY